MEDAAFEETRPTIGLRLARKRVEERARREERELVLRAARNRETLIIVGNEMLMALLTVLVASGAINAGVPPLCYVGMGVSLFALEQPILHNLDERIPGAYVLIAMGWMLMLSGIFIPT